MKDRRLLNVVARHGLTLLLLTALAAESLWLMAPVQFFGDEHHYSNVGLAVASGLLDHSSFHQVILAVVDKGWFLPGAGFLLMPVYLFNGLEPSVPDVRIYSLSLNLALLVLIARELTTRFSPLTTNIFLAICLVSPFYVSYLAGAWSDIFAMHSALLFLLWLDRNLARSKMVTAAAAGLFLAGVVYIRPIYFPFLALPVALWVIVALQNQAGFKEAARPIVRRGLIMTAIFVALLAPWSYTVSDLYGPTIFLTTPKIAGQQWCANPQWNPNIPAGGELKKWGQFFRQTQEQARKNGIGFSEQARILSEEACADVTPEIRLQRNSRAIERFFLHPEGYVQRFMLRGCGGDACKPAGTMHIVLNVTRVNWFVLLGLGVVITLVPFGRSRNGSYLLPVFLKAAVCVVCMHPLISISHSRYHVVLIPVFAMMVALLASGHFRIWRCDPGEKALSWLLAAGQLVPFLVLAVYMTFLVFWPAG